ncbi:cupin domain-containing protein [Burkholderia sp. Bp8992]|nr:cupin domain-containing protein [Burkholderia sp. Bp8992]RQS35576.1 cupin domain-containing protein [Burkholderia sp. Bp8992]
MPAVLDISTITDALAPSGEPVQYRLPPAKLIAGDPLQTLTPGFTSPCGRFSTGIWESTPGRWHVAYTEAEYCEILEGTSVIADRDGNTKTVRAGDRFTIPPGFSGTWEVVERTRKIFVAYDEHPPE